MTYKITVTLDTHDFEAVTGMKELLAVQAQQYGDVSAFRVEELMPEQVKTEGFR